MPPLEWPAEPELCPYAPQLTLEARRLLVLAPHPDDEVLGCGGLVAAMLAVGARVHMVIASDGGLGGDAAARERESNAAAQVLAGSGAVPELQFWRLPDRHLAALPDLAARLQTLIRQLDPDCVLMPSMFEIHPDHRALFLAGIQSIPAAGDQTQLLLYEVGQPLMPDVLIDITQQLERKRRALLCFGSQLRQQAYDDQLLGLNRYRAYTLGPQVTHAEAYMRVPRTDWSRGLPAVLRTVEKRLFQRFGLPTA